MNPNKDEIRYRGVPAEISHNLTDKCWEFGDIAYWTIEDLEEGARHIFNACLHADPEEWTRRLADAHGKLNLVPDGLRRLRRRMRTIEKMSPKKLSAGGTKKS